MRSNKTITRSQARIARRRRERATDRALQVITRGMFALLILSIAATFVCGVHHLATGA